MQELKTLPGNTPRDLQVEVTRPKTRRKAMDGKKYELKSKMKKMRNQKPERMTWQIKRYLEKAKNREDVSRPKIRRLWQLTRYVSKANNRRNQVCYDLLIQKHQRRPSSCVNAQRMKAGALAYTLQ